MVKSIGIQNIEESARGLQNELVRKSIHILIASVPMMAVINLPVTIGLLASGIIVYTYAEMLRCRGEQVYLISRITAIASRDRDQGKFVLGPVTLGMGALLALILYPNPAASIGIYSLAFGDGIASVVGKIWGRIRIPGSGGKTVAGTLACFTAVYAVSLAVSGKNVESLMIAFVAAFIELLPLKDFDNVAIPLITASIASQLLI